MAIIHGSYNGICQLNKHAAHKKDSEHSGSREHKLSISSSLFLSFSETCVLSSFFFFHSQDYKHGEFNVVIKPPVIHSLTFTSKAFCFPSYQEILEVGEGSVFSGP